MAATPRALMLSRYCDLSSLKPTPSPQTLIPLSPSLLISRHLLSLRRPRSPSAAAAACLVSGVDGGGVSDDFVSTRRSGAAGRREFSALAGVLRRIEPLDSSVIGKGVLEPARDAMKRTISAMLGLLPSEQFGIIIRVSKQPVHHLLVSSIITGYTLWNAEYRVSLMRNFDRSSCKEDGVPMNSARGVEVLGEEIVGREDGCVAEGIDYSEGMRTPSNLGESSPPVLSYIKELELELLAATEELDAHRQEYIHLERNKDDKNDLLKYLRSLEPYMVTELSQPSSSEVEEIIQQLGQNIHIKIFNDGNPSFSQGSEIQKSVDKGKDVDHSDSIVTTRDYLAKLLFWCMMLGHHLRSLEYRLHLSCGVGLL